MSNAILIKSKPLGEIKFDSDTRVFGLEAVVIPEKASPEEVFLAIERSPDMLFGLNEEFECPVIWDKVQKLWVPVTETHPNWQETYDLLNYSTEFNDPKELFQFLTPFPPRFIYLFDANNTQALKVVDVDLLQEQFRTPAEVDHVLMVITIQELAAFSETYSQYEKRTNVEA